MEVDGAAGTAAAGGAKPLTPEEEALRRSTDCVYFLASPLTCKKGNECDFRHSEGARMNPRDCWYWLNGSCLNPKCSFRHPPIDGLFGAPTPGIPPVSSHYGAYSSGKQMVPCYYFQKGNCLKGDRCPFYHGPQAAGNNTTDQAVKVSSLPLELPQAKKNEETAAPNNLTQQGARIIDDRSMVHITKSGVGVTPTELASNAVESRPNSEQAPNSIPAAKKSFTVEEDHPMHYQNQLPVEGDSVQDWNQNFQIPPTDDLPQNSREADDFLGESSPGFDVLVDNDADGAAYLHDEEDFGRDMYPVEDYEYAPADFDTQAHHESEQFNGMGENGQIGQLYDGYDRKRHRSSSERSIDRPFHSDRTFHHRGLDRDEIDGSDLRHQLRRRRINGPSTTISPERANGGRHWRDEHYRERAHGVHHMHNDRRQGPRGSTLSSRLQARIKLPGRSPDRVETRFEDERDGRLRGRFSPARRVDFHGGRNREPGKHQERSHQISSELVSSVRHADGLFRRDAVDSARFPARRNFGEPRKANGIVETEVSLDFEGPKPLSVILQRKREAAGGNNSSSNYEKSAEVAVMRTGFLVESEKKGCANTIMSEDCKSGLGDEEYKEEDDIPVEGHGQSSSHGDKFEGEDAAEVDPEGNQEADNYDQREGESDDYETIEGHDYKSEDENAYQDDEDLDDDDDFAQKVGVVFS
ncbi:zinc finger CCCH domain-containing protein 32-like [Panicum virgatum]|uniref:C3H1-type domain-containing protein n=1 Tax=Panicum virgatum TaxID=38727 RepID=A0A8T0Q405_PANVG|nr:zinc finger CCCH domain-containing protein 32-like [Panicum virgatum]KAG2569657.1 hypothetical protein PVAP13_7NG434700 [Panicum virgatum]